MLLLMLVDDRADECRPIDDAELADGNVADEFGADAVDECGLDRFESDAECAIKFDDFICC